MVRHHRSINSFAELLWKPCVILRLCRATAFPECEVVP